MLPYIKEAITGNSMLRQKGNIFYGITILVSGMILIGCRPDAKTEDNPWLYQVAMESGEGLIELSGTPDPSRVLFLHFGSHSFEPGSLILEKKAAGIWKEIGNEDSVYIGEPLPLGLFQGLKAIPWCIPSRLYRKGDSYRFRVSREGGVHGSPDRDEYWDQIIVVREEALRTGNTAALENFTLTESGRFGEALPPHVRNIHTTDQQIRQLEAKMTDPVMDLLKESRERELGWKELESLALPLDYQKILLAGIHDANPGYAYQNGQWFVVWPGNEGPVISDDWQMRKDIWFAPAIRIGNEVIRPAPLSARTSFRENENGRILPMLLIEWKFQSPDGHEKIISQSLFSEEMEGIPQVFAHLKLEDPDQESSLLIGHGKRANAFFWGDRSQARSFVPYFTSRSKLAHKNEYILMDETESVTLRASEPVTISHWGISETFLEFGAGTPELFISTPQIRSKGPSKPLTREIYTEALQKFEKKWDAALSTGAYAELPSAEWTRKIDSWLTQVSSITRIQLDGKDRLSYGSYIYCNYYFGIEEGWPAVAFAMWGKGEEAKRQTEIILSEENLDKNNYHHQYRNGLSSWYAAEVARLTGDREWLKDIAPALVSNGYWTIRARKENTEKRSSIGRGLLPSHIYGGDIATPAYSLYSSGTCLKGLIETSDVFKRAELQGLEKAANDFSQEAIDFRKRLVEVIHEVLYKQTTPPFLPFALEISNKPGNHEGPFDRITDTELGNYWNLFAPLFLHLEIFRYRDPELPSEWITGYAENHGGLFGGLPRFYTGLDAVYAIGNIDEYIERSKTNIDNRAKALASLESFMVYASSQNGHTIQEVSGFFPERFDWNQYERVVREALWNFGMYSAESYLSGHSSFTEPLGSGAGEGLMLIRKSLIDEVRDEQGLPNGELFLLSTVPGEWIKEGKEIKLKNFPTAYGTFDLDIKSHISSKGEIDVSYRYRPDLGNNRADAKAFPAWYELEKIYLRLVPAPEDQRAGKKLHVGYPVKQLDQWTIELPVLEQGDFIIKF